MNEKLKTTVIEIAKTALKNGFTTWTKDPEMLNKSVDPIAAGTMLYHFIDQHSTGEFPIDFILCRLRPSRARLSVFDGSGVYPISGNSVSAVIDFCMDNYFHDTGVGYRGRDEANLAALIPMMEAIKIALLAKHCECVDFSTMDDDPANTIMGELIPSVNNLTYREVLSAAVPDLEKSTNPDIIEIMTIAGDLVLFRTNGQTLIDTTWAVFTSLFRKHCPHAAHTIDVAKAKDVYDRIVIGHSALGKLFGQGGASEAGMKSTFN